VSTGEEGITVKALRYTLISMVLMGLVTAFFGCGVSDDEYQKVVAELNGAKDQLSKANDRIAQLEDSLQEAQAKIGVEEPIGMETVTEAATGVQEKLAAAQQEAADLRAKVESLTDENSSLKGMLDKLKAQVSELEGKLKELKIPSGNTGLDLLK
jgi:chromosome segregation ATPase